MGALWPREERGRSVSTVVLESAPYLPEWTPQSNRGRFSSRPRCYVVSQPQKGIMKFPSSRAMVILGAPRPAAAAAPRNLSSESGNLCVPKGQYWTALSNRCRSHKSVIWTPDKPRYQGLNIYRPALWFEIFQWREPCPASRALLQSAPTSTHTVSDGF